MLLSEMEECGSDWTDSVDCHRSVCYFCMWRESLPGDHAAGGNSCHLVVRPIEELEWKASEAVQIGDQT